MGSRYIPQKLQKNKFSEKTHYKHI